MKRILAIITAIAIFAGFTACGAEDSVERSENKSKTTVTTTTTTTAETTAKATTTTVTTTTTAITTTARYKQRSSGDLEDGTLVEVLEDNQTTDWILNLYYTSNDIDDNIRMLSDSVTSVLIQIDEDYDSMPSNVTICGYYDDELLYSYLINKDSDEDYMSLINVEWFNNEYKDFYNNSPEYNFEEQVIYDGNGIRITYTGYNPEGSIFGPEIKLLIENNTDKPYTIQNREFSANDFMLSTSFSSTVSAGKKINDTIIIFNSSLENSALDPADLHHVELSFHVYGDNRDDRFDTEMISFDL